MVGTVFFEKIGHAHFHDVYSSIASKNQVAFGTDVSVATGDSDF